jgi:hypothetical protein
MVYAKVFTHGMKTHTQKIITHNTYIHLQRDGAKHEKEEAVRLRMERVKLQEEVRGLGPD